MGTFASQINKNYLSTEEILETNDNIYLDTIEVNGKEYHYYVCLPDDIENTHAVNAHYHGWKSGGVDSTCYELNYYNNNESKTIGIIIDNDFYSYNNNIDNGQFLNDIINKIEQKYGATVVQVNADGNSWGGIYAVAAIAQYNKINGVTRNNFVSLYGCTDLDRTSWAPRMTDEDYKEGLEHTYLLMYGEMSSTTRKFGNLAAGIIKIENPSEVGEKAHDLFPQIATRDGSIDFAAGNSDLKNLSNYEFYIYNKETDKYEPTTYEEIKKLVPEITEKDILDVVNKQKKYNRKYLSNLRNQEYEYKINDVIINHGINEIKNKISDCYFLNNKLNYSSCTTSIPNYIVDIINNIEDKLVNDLLKIDEKLQNINAIEASIEIMENKEVEKIEYLN